MDLKPFQDSVRAIVAKISGLATQWEDQPRDMVDPNTGAICLLSIPAIVPLGTDEKRTIYNPDAASGEELSLEYAGNRLVTLTIKVESYDQTTGRSAQSWVETIRTKLFWRPTGDALNDAGAAMVRVERPVDLSMPRDDRMVSIASIDAIICARFRIQDPTATFGFITSVGLVPQFDPAPSPDIAGPFTVALEGFPSQRPPYGETSTATLSAP